MLFQQTMRRKIGNAPSLPLAEFVDPFGTGPFDGSDKILDVGTGPGAWLLEMARSVDPSVSMVGIDIESGLVPTSYPTNVEFRVESVMDLPSEWSTTFSLVHQRFFVIALQTNQWPVALREIFRVLRPGGWVQLCEAEKGQKDEGPKDEGPKDEGPAGNLNKSYVEKLGAMYHSYLTSCNLLVDPAQHIPALLKEAGFVDICEESQLVAGMRALKTPTLDAGGYGHISSEAEFDALLDGVERELDEAPTAENPGIQINYVIFWARKPTAKIGHTIIFESVFCEVLCEIRQLQYYRCLDPVSSGREWAAFLDLIQIWSSLHDFPSAPGFEA
ncbi:S-adenosyl-L-methionine-dependent methyltransferase [Mycena rosella]|uniref:S-adenosyl-L-methionine-dependent methyltransferase n=1 Tax=Mycena rosella TaxID=1033263 RepID=A0AAD7GHW5_MYCRO|nr:S-adenosyl-L-methionine-dependent methyltransferase [Mycena rosella]